jgi:hypothetical protein
MVADGTAVLATAALATAATGCPWQAANKPRQQARNSALTNADKRGFIFSASLRLCVKFLIMRF